MRLKLQNNKNPPNSTFPPKQIFYVRKSPFQISIYIFLLNTDNQTHSYIYLNKN